MDGRQWVLLIGVGLGALIGQYGITFGYAFAKPNQISIFDYAMVVISAILGILVLNEWPTWAAWLGMGLIFLAFLLMFLYNRALIRQAAGDP